MHIEVIVHQILILAILVVIGAGATRTGILTYQFSEGLAKLIFNLTLPLLILTNLAELELTPRIIRNGGLVILFSYTALLVLFGMGILSSLVQRLDTRAGTIHILHSMFGNIIFLGFPLINALFPGGEGLLYATLFHLASNSLQWTLGIHLLIRGKQEKITTYLKHLLNPNTIALFLGLIMMGFSLRLPGILQKSLGGLGNTTLFLSMLYIGSILAGISLKGILKKGYVIVISFNKLLLGPFLLTIGIGGLCRWLDLPMDPMAFSVVILQAAMPCMAIVVVMARTFGADEKHAAENVFLSTILSLVTLPLTWLFLQKILY